MDVVRKRFLVTGRVQGVGFRWFTRAHAERLDLVGYVCNLPDGSVLCEAQGSCAAVAELGELLHAGPPGASVQRVTVTDLAVDGASLAFLVRL